MSQNLETFDKFQESQLDNLVDFEKCCKTHIYLQRSAPIRPKTSENSPKIHQNFAPSSRRGRREPRHAGGPTSPGLAASPVGLAASSSSLLNSRVSSHSGIALECRRTVVVVRIDFVLIQPRTRPLKFARSTCVSGGFRRERRGGRPAAGGRQTAAQTAGARGGRGARGGAKE